MSADAGLVGAALEAPGGRWFEGLAAPLAESGWRAVGDATGLDKGTYGTSRHLAADSSRERDVAATLNLPGVFCRREPVVLETLHGAALKRYADLGLEFYDRPVNWAGRHRDRLREAFDRIGQVPSLAAAVGAVLAVVHAVRPPGSDYDVSYSDPDLPFSVFVGIDGERRPNGSLRLAEGIVHECMHLQLTLMERAAPMVAGSAGRLYSPWQGTARPVLGVLHGLYVFRVIQDFHWALLEGGWVDPAERNFVARRIRTVEDEATSVADLAGSDELTAMGRRLVERLLAD